MSVSRVVIPPLISSDAHVVEPPWVYSKYLNRKFQDRAPYLKDEGDWDRYVIPGLHHDILTGSLGTVGKLPVDQLKKHSKMAEWHVGCYDPDARVALQDQGGIKAEMLYTSVGLTMVCHRDLEYRQALIDSFNMWLGEFCSRCPTRLFGIAQTGIADARAGARDVKRAKQLGLYGVHIPVTPGTGSYADPSYDEFWGAAVDAGLPIIFHVMPDELTPLVQARSNHMNAVLVMHRAAQDVLATVVFDGVFDRHPKLKFLVAEADVSWLPHWCHRADAYYTQFRALRNSVKLNKLPSQYVWENCHFTLQTDWPALQMQGMIDVDRLIWSDDFPHNASVWPHARKVVEDAVTGLLGHNSMYPESALSQRTVNRLFHDGTVDFYNLPLEKLDAE